MTLEKITYPLAEAVQGTELLHLDDAFDRSISGLICGLVPMTLCEESSLVWSELSSILTYNTPKRQGLKELSFATGLGQVNALIHGDDSVTAAIVDAGPKGDRLLTVPLRATQKARDKSAREHLIAELTRWLEAAEHTAPAAWAGSAPCPEGIRVPWCDIDPVENDKITFLVEAIFAALTIAHPAIPKVDIVVSVEGRQILPDGSITAPRLKMERRVDSWGSLEDIPSPALARMGNLALRNLTTPGSLIAQERDRMNRMDSIHLLPSVVASHDGSSEITLSAHEQIAAKDFLQEQAGLA
jgi:hypothetical protein